MYVKVMVEGKHDARIKSMIQVMRYREYAMEDLWEDGICQISDLYGKGNIKKFLARLDKIQIPYHVERA